MTSIHTNIGATTSLSVMRSIYASIQTVEENAATGLRIQKASDNAAYWSIATGMRGDISSLSAASDAINLSMSIADTAYSGLSTVIDLVTTMRSKFLMGVDASYTTLQQLQTEVKALQDTYVGVTQSSSFAGENWLYRSSLTQSNSTSLVTGVIRAADGSFKVQSEKIDLTQIMLIDIGPNNPTLGFLTMAYSSNGGGNFTFTRHGFVKNNGKGTVNMNTLPTDDVSSTNNKVRAGVAMIDAMLKDLTTAAATVGAIRSGIDRQQSFVQQILDTHKKSIGRLVDADIDATANRLRALQVREKLVSQNLSIANAQPSVLQQLFR